METNQHLEALKQAYKVTRWMVAGLLPSQDHAVKARSAVSEFAQSEMAEDACLDVSAAERVAGFGASGVLPSQSACAQASQQILAAIHALSDVDSMEMRRRLMSTQRG